MDRYLSLKEFADRAGLAYGTVKGYWHRNRHLMPEPDAQIGTDPAHYGWLPETVDNWNRPGRGARTDLKD